MVEIATISNKNENSFVKKFSFQRSFFKNNFRGFYCQNSETFLFYLWKKMKMSKSSSKVFEIKMVMKNSI